MEKKHENLHGNVLPKVANYVWSRFLFSKIQISFNDQKTSYVRIFTVLSILEVWLPDHANISFSTIKYRVYKNLDHISGC